MRKLGYCALFLCMLIPLRSDAGGYHAPNLFFCYLFSFTALTFTLLRAKEAGGLRLAVISVFALGSLLLIFFVCTFGQCEQTVKRAGEKGNKKTRTNNCMC